MFTSKSVEAIIEDALRNKLQNYNPEPAHMPFHTRLLGKDRMALYSFIHSISTNFGTAIFEQVAKEIASGVFSIVELQVDIVSQFSIAGQPLAPRPQRRSRSNQVPVFRRGAQDAIADIVADLRAAVKTPDHIAEIARIAERGESGDGVIDKLRNVDIFLSAANQVILIDLKTAKPNVSGFEKYKEDMLRWAAAVLHRDKNADVRTVIAIPYNPYEPEPYRRWTMRGMLEVKDQSQLMVAQEFWNFLAGGEDIYQDLLACFEHVGCTMRDEIDDYFQNLGNRQYT